MNCKYSGCNVPEGECSGECMTNHTESLEEIFARLGIERNTDFNDWSVEDHHWATLLSDPAILAHIPAVKAMQEENERLKALASKLDGQLGKRPCQNDRCVNFNQQQERIADLESQLAALQGGAEWMIQELRNLQSQIHFGPACNVPDEIDRIVKDCETVCEQTPQPAISGKVPPGYALVPISLTDEMRDAGNEVILDRARLVRAWAAMLAASPSAPIAEGDK